MKLAEELKDIEIAESVAKQARIGSSADFAITLLWIVSLLALVCGIVAALYLSRLIRKPLMDAVAAANAISLGDLNLDVDYYSKDEIGDLARAFNTMTDRLRDLLHREEARAAELEQEVAERKRAEAALKRLNQELDQRVEERTAELAQANEEIQTLNERLKAENLRMTAELDVTRRLQEMLLPSDKELQRIEGVDIAGSENAGRLEQRIMKRPTGIAQLVGKLNDQYTVLGGQADQHDQPDLL